MLFIHYGINPFEFEKNITINELQIFIIGLFNKEEEIQKQKQQSSQTNNKLIKCLAGIRDILNIMFDPLNKKR